MRDSMDRTQNYSSLSEKLARLSDKGLMDLIEDATPLHTGIDGKSFDFTFDDIRIFLKKIPLSAIEMKPENTKSTANLFNLPMFCQYGLGAPGFTSWRELYANQLATKWVLGNECEHFSILYHWRILPASPAKPMNEIQKETLEKQIQFWGDSSAVRNRFAAISNPESEICLFLEFVPQTLLSWLKGQHKLGVDIFSDAVAFADSNLNLTIAFMKDHGLIHFDTHFENIMTDGQRLYFNDFGLVLGFDFDLNEEEMEFARRHQNYDQCGAAVGFAHAVTVCEFGENNWKENLRAY